MQSAYDINQLVREAQTRWLKPAEVYCILKNYEEHQLTHQVPQRPTSGSLYLFNKRVVKYFRKDGHSWRRRRDQRTIAEAHERLKVGNVEALNCYYAHGEVNTYFQRRSYWILDAPYDHIVLVHYRDVREGATNSGPTSQFSPINSSTFSPSPNSFTTQQQDSSVVIDGSYETYYNESSPSSGVSSTETINIHGMNQFNIGQRANETYCSSGHNLSDTLRKLKQQLSLNEDEVKECNAIYLENEDSNDMLREYGLSGQTSNGSDNLSFQQQSGIHEVKECNAIYLENEDSNDMLREYGLSGQTSNGSDNLSFQQQSDEADIWKDMLDSSTSFQSVDSQVQVSEWETQNASLMMPQKFDSLEYPATNAYGINPNSYSLLSDQDVLGIPVEDNITLTIAQRQKFTIQEISPDWCYTSKGAKIVIVGSFLCDPLESEWACMFGDTEVPVEIIQQGVIRCQAPPHLQGKVTICLTSRNRESCSEIRDFEYRDDPNNSPPETEPAKSSEELLLLIRLVQTLLSDSSSVDMQSKLRFAEDSWDQIIDNGTSTLSGTLSWLLQELLKDKLEIWFSNRLQKDAQKGCSLSKKEQGIIHMIAGLGFEWALQPILNSGVSINFRDINGWTALHWAAKFGREKMVAALIAAGASAGAVTDPNSQDPNGKTPASIAATCGHVGLAGYLSEISLTSHLTSLALEENELSKGSAAAEAERTVNSFSEASSSTNEDQVSLKQTLAAVRNAAQAAARIQSAFRAHSFRRRAIRESKVNIAGDSGDEYDIFENDIRELSAASKLAFGGSRNHNTAALSIQKKYRGWKGRKDFLTLRQKVVKIQAHVRGYQVRKNYKVCWAVGVLEKVVLRWRRRGVGLRGFRHDVETIDECDEDEDILKVFRKQKVDAAIDEAVSRVLSMVESPDARQQYHRLLEKYRQAKAQLESTESDTVPSAYLDMDN